MKRIRRRLKAALYSQENRVEEELSSQLQEQLGFHNGAGRENGKSWLNMIRQFFIVRMQNCGGVLNAALLTWGSQIVVYSVDLRVKPAFYTVYLLANVK